MTVQEYQTIKTIIYACSLKVLENGEAVPYANADRVIAALDKIFADELGVAHEPMMRQLWKDQEEARKALQKEQTEQASENRSSAAANFLTRLIQRSK